MSLLLLSYSSLYFSISRQNHCYKCRTVVHRTVAHRTVAHRTVAHPDTCSPCKWKSGHLLSSEFFICLLGNRPYSDTDAAEPSCICSWYIICYSHLDDVQQIKPVCWWSGIICSSWSRQWVYVIDNAQNFVIAIIT